VDEAVEVFQSKQADGVTDTPVLRVVRPTGAVHFVVVWGGPVAAEEPDGPSELLMNLLIK